MTQAVALVLGGVVLIVLIATLSRRTGIAAPLLLLVAGIGVGYLPFVHVGEIPPAWILDGVLPPLLYASAVNLPVTDLRRNLRPIAGLAVVLVAISTIASGAVLNLVLPAVGLFGALALGAVVSPTDAVAATSIAKRLGLPDRVVSVLEGESLLNDATALTLLAAATGALRSGSVSIGGVVLTFLYSVVVAVLVGGAVGWVSVLVRQRLGDPVLTTAISFVVPFAAFAPAQGLGASGVLATVVAGLVTGVGGRRRFDGTQRVNDATNWRTIQFLLEQGVFLAMGLQLHSLIDSLLSRGGDLLQPLGLGALLVVVLLVVRAVYVTAESALLGARESRVIARVDAGERPRGPLRALSDRIATRRPEESVRRSQAIRKADLEAARRARPSWRTDLVITWSGMRGVVTLAAAQSLPDTALRPLLVLVAFVVAVLSLAGFGTTLPLVIRAAKVQGADERTRRTELSALMRQILGAGVRVLDDPDQTEVDGEQVDPAIVDRLRKRYSRQPDPDAEPDAALTHREQIGVVQRRIRDAARAELLDASATGAYSSSTIAQAQRLLDTADARDDSIG